MTEKFKLRHCHFFSTVYFYYVLNHNIRMSGGGKNTNHGGFTLVELAVVIAVIGLIIAAVSAGRDLLRQAKIKSVIGEMNEYLAAASNFRSKYFYRPGDLPRASALLYFVAPALPTAHAEEGNGRWDTQEELNKAWPQLYQAEMIKQSLSGTGSTAIVGINRPTSKLEGAGWTFKDNVQIDPGDGIRYFYHVLRIGGNAADDFLSTPVLTVSDHAYIDGKIDTANTPVDGKYFVAETACIRDIGGGVFKYATDDSVKCTGNIAEISNASSYTPPP